MSILGLFSILFKSYNNGFIFKDILHRTNKQIPFYIYFCISYGQSVGNGQSEKRPRPTSQVSKVSRPRLPRLLISNNITKRNLSIPLIGY